MLNVIPGPNAALSALVFRDFPPEIFFLQDSCLKLTSKRKEKFELAYQPFTLIFYESPLRIKNLLQEMLKSWGIEMPVLQGKLQKYMKKQGGAP